MTISAQEKKVPDDSFAEDQSARCIRLKGGCTMKVDVDRGTLLFGPSSLERQK
jgi:hypothetical protein